MNNHFRGSIKKTFKDCLDLVERKNADYAGEEDPFKNFRSAEVVGVSVEGAILVRTLDKLARIGNLIGKEGTQVDESIEDSIQDGINYLAILKAYIEHEN